MQAAQRATPSHHRASGSPQEVTLLELVQAIGEETEDDREVVAIVSLLLRSGRVRLCGNFRGASPESFR